MKKEKDSFAQYKIVTTCMGGIRGEFSRASIVPPEELWQSIHGYVDAAWMDGNEWGRLDAEEFPAARKPQDTSPIVVDGFDAYVPQALEKLKLLFPNTTFVVNYKDKCIVIGVTGVRFE